MTTERRRISRRRAAPRRGCERCTDRAPIDHKEIDFLQRFVAPSGKILPSRVSGCTAKCQRRIETAIKRARHLALLPYAPEHQRTRIPQQS